MSEIKRILDVKQRVLLLGEMGMSKTTILMEILCDYFDKDYEILYNWGNIQIKNEEDLIGFVEDLLNRDKKILVAVDNIHDKKLLPIFYIIERLETHVKTKNLIFLLTARIPEYNLIVKERLFEVQEQIHRNSIQKFRDDNTFHYRIPYFSDREVQEFIKKYKVEFVENDEKYLSILAKKTLEYSGGNPIMVRYYVLEQGLRKSAEDRYLHYLIDPVNMKPDAMKVQTILACSLLEFGGVQVNDELLERMKLIKHARDLRESLLSCHEDGIWKTLHLRWDMELITFLFAIKEENLVEERINYLRDAIRSIFSIEDEKMASSVIASLYNIPTINARGISRIPIEIIERAVQNQVPSFLSNHTKSRMFSLDIATAYRQLGKYEVALDWCNKSLELDQSFIGSWHNKGVTLSRIGNYQEAIDCFNMALKLDPFNADTLHNKGITLRKLGDNKGAMESFNLALKLRPTNAELLMDMSGMYLQERKLFKALEFCLKALKIDTRNPQIWNNMGLTYAALLMSYTALKCFKVSIELDEAYSNAWYNMASTLDDIGMYVEAIECYENAIKNDPNNADAWNNKGTVLHKLGRINEAIECLDKAIEKDPYKSNSYDNKRKALLDKRRRWYWA